MGPPPMRLGFRSRIAPSTRVIASLVVHQIPDRRRALGEFGRVLTPTGILVVRTVTPEAAARWIPNRFFPSIACAQAAVCPRSGNSESSSPTWASARSQPKPSCVTPQLNLGDVERALRIDVADRYPFLDHDELDRGLTNVREH
jgi:hypothetical protein